MPKDLRTCGSLQPFRPEAKLSFGAVHNTLQRTDGEFRVIVHVWGHFTVRGMEGATYISLRPHRRTVIDAMHEDMARSMF